MKKIKPPKKTRHDKAAQKLLIDVPESEAKDNGARALASVRRGSFGGRPGWLERFIDPSKQQAVEQRIVGETAFEAYVEKAPLSEVCDLLTYTLEERIKDFSTTTGDSTFRGFAWSVQVQHNNQAAQSPEQVEYDVAVGSMLDDGMFEKVHIMRNADGSFNFEREYHNDHNAADDHRTAIVPDDSAYQEKYIKEQLVWAIDGIKNGALLPPQPAQV